MRFEIELRKFGDSFGIVFPELVLARLNMREGESLILTENGDGSIHLVPARKEVPEKTDVAIEISNRYANALRELSK